ncbi:allatostatin-A receptor-like [Amphiura filiformis]|uniref:allatostatin-A receptor-like n=1 Tax=Amphiura filiformis TaxID=82378 RepID=UPI003B2130B5
MSTYDTGIETTDMATAMQYRKIWRAIAVRTPLDIGSVMTTFLHTNTNYLIANLAITDFLVCTFATLEVITHRLTFNNWTLNSFGKLILCKLDYVGLLRWISTTSSALALVLVSGERFIGIVYPLHYHYIVTPKRLRICIVCQWITAIASEIKLVFVLYYDEDIGQCLYNENILNVPAQIALFGLQFCISYAIPVLILIFIYTRMLASLKGTGMLSEIASDQRAKTFRQARKNIFSNLLIITILFIAFLTPLQVVSLLFDYFPEYFGVVSYEEFGIELQKLYLISLFVLPLFNSVINPIVYSLRYKQFKKAINVSVFCICRGSWS